MGKIRVKTLGFEAQEEEQKKRDEKRRAAKRARKEGDKVKAPGKGKGGQRVVAVGPSAKEIEDAEKALKKKDFDQVDDGIPVSSPTPKKQGVKDKKEANKVERPKKASEPRVRSKRYQELRKQIDRSTFYDLSEALSLVVKTAKTSFTGSVEAHIGMRKTAKQLSLKAPKSTNAGKKKAGEKKSEKSSENNTLRLSFEKKQPVAHAVLGKTTASEKDLRKEYERIVKYIGHHNILKTTLSSTMGPGVKVKSE